MKVSFRTILASTAAWVVATGTASAQNSQPAGVDAPAENTRSQVAPVQTGADSTIVVIGTRLGQGSSSDVKRRALQSVSSLTAEDLQKIPDTSLADTLRRIPGVSLNENAGGGIPTIRGLSDVESRLNGRNLTSTVGRGYDVAALPADLVSGIDVYKTPSASQIEGGIGGVIDYRTRRPFDFDGLAGALTAKAGYSDLGKTWRPYLSGFISDRWSTGLGEFGLLAGGGYQKRTVTEHVSRVDSNGLTSGAGGTNIDTPNNAIKRYYFGDADIETGFVSGQWRPDERFEFTADFLYNREGMDFSNQSLQAQLSSATPAGPFTTYPGTNAFRSGTWNNVQIQSISNEGKGYFATYQGALSGRFEQGPLTLSGDVSWTHTVFDYSSPTLTLTTTAPAVSYDNSPKTPNFTVTGVDPANPAAWRLGNYSTFPARDSSTEWAYRGDAIYQLGDVLKNIQVGVRFDRRTVGHQFSLQSVNAPIGSTAVAGTAFTGLTADNFFGGGLTQPQWISPINLQANNTTIRPLYGLSGSVPSYDPAQAYGADERVLSGYGQLTFGFPIAGIPVDGNVGVRVARTRLSVTGVQTTSAGSSPIDARQSFTDALPMINLRGELAHQLYLRLAFSKQITRAPFYQLSPSVTLDTVNRTGSGGNPALSPLRADQYDAALEWYFAPNSNLYAAGFYKDITGYIRNQSAVESVGGVNYLINRPQNVDQANIKGFELGYQQRFGFLPGLLSGLGLQATYTFVESSKERNQAGYFVGLEQLGKHNYSVALTYDHAGLTGSIAYSGRGRFLEATSGDALGRPLYHEPYGQLDVSLAYALTPNVNLLANAVNLSRAHQTEVFANRMYLNQTFIEDRRLFAGVQVKFGKPGK